ncbi:hypothetical protein [Vibrio phage phiKT1024]|nr:hypothetical protein [Vibrio phage phiKT1024]
MIVDDVKRKYRHYKHDSFRDMVTLKYCPEIFWKIMSEDLKAFIENNWIPLAKYDDFESMRTNIVNDYPEIFI